MTLQENSSNGQIKGRIVLRQNGLLHFYPTSKKTIEYHKKIIGIPKIPVNVRYLEKKTPGIEEKLKNSPTNAIDYSLPKKDFELAARQYVRVNFKKILEMHQNRESSLVDIILEKDDLEN